MIDASTFFHGSTLMRMRSSRRDRSFFLGHESYRPGRLRAAAWIELLEPRTLLSAIVMTDMQAYSPGASMSITGSGYQAHETIHLRVVNERTGGTYTAWTASDDASGRFTSDWTIPSDAVGDTLRLTASGATSGSTAVATFTGGSTITTDQPDYPPGSTATISGAGWQPNETINLDVFNVT